MNRLLISMICLLIMNSIAFPDDNFDQVPGIRSTCWRSSTTCYNVENCPFCSEDGYIAFMDPYFVRFNTITDYQISPTIVLTVGGCSNGEKGDTGTGVYLAQSMGSCRCTCYCPCCDAEDTYPIGGANEGLTDRLGYLVKISGNQKAFNAYFPNGLYNIEQLDRIYVKSLFWGTDQAIRPINSSTYKQDAVFDIAINRPLMDTKRGGGLYPSDDNSQLTYSYMIPGPTVHGQIIVKQNKRVDFDPFTLKPDLSNTPIGYMAKIVRGGSGEDSFWKFNARNCNIYTDECEMAISGGTWQGIFYRGKIPAWELEVGCGTGGLPDYMTCSGWYGCFGGENNRYYWQSYGTGTIYYLCNQPDNNSGSSTKWLINQIVYCPIPNWDWPDCQSQSQTLWTFEYEYDSEGKARSKNTYNGATLGLSSKVYAYTWTSGSGGSKQLSIDFKLNGNTTRSWSGKYDSQGRLVESNEGCSSGCGEGSGGYRKVEYLNQPGFDDRITKQYDSQGHLILQTDYEVIQRSNPEDAVDYTFNNSSFESPDVADGGFSSGVPTGWLSIGSNPNNIEVHDYSVSQWSTRYSTGQSVPEGTQVLTLSNAGIQQMPPDLVVKSDTRYYVYADVGTPIDSTISHARIRLIAFDASNTETTIVDIDVDESAAPSQQGIQLIEGQWVAEAGQYDSMDNIALHSQRIKLVVEGNRVDIDNIRVSSISYYGGYTQPLIIAQSADNPNPGGDPTISIVQWDYNPGDASAIERRWINSDDARIAKYIYANSTFTQVKSKIEFENLNDNPSNPTGRSFTTRYEYPSVPSVPNPLSYSNTFYPSSKRMDVEEWQNGQIVQSYTRDIISNHIYNRHQYTYDNAGHVLSHVSPQGAETVNSYDYRGLILETDEPEVEGLQQVVTYEYDNARRLKSEWRKDSSNSYIKTRYDYDPVTMLLVKMVEDANYSYDAQYGQKTNGREETTEYRYNVLGDKVVEKHPDGSVSGASYGTNGKVTSEFVLADPTQYSTINPDNLMAVSFNVLSLTLFYYDNEGRIEYIKKIKTNEPLAFWLPTHNPNNPCEVPPNSNRYLVVTKYEYDILGRKKKVTEDLCGLALVTQYEYNYQGELTKTILPNGKWAETYRDGRGLIISEIVGYGQGTGRTEVAITEFSYDENKNLIEQIAPDGTRTVYHYDNIDRVISIRRGLPSQ